MKTHVNHVFHGLSFLCCLTNVSVSMFPDSRFPFPVLCFLWLRFLFSVFCFLLSVSTFAVSCLRRLRFPFSSSSESKSPTMEDEKVYFLKCCLFRWRAIETDHLLESDLFRWRAVEKDHILKSGHFRWRPIEKDHILKSDLFRWGAIEKGHFLRSDHFRWCPIEKGHFSKSDHFRWGTIEKGHFLKVIIFSVSHFWIGINSHFHFPRIRDRVLMTIQHWYPLKKERMSTSAQRSLPG